MERNSKWRWVVGLAAAGIADSLYLLLYQTGRIERLVCPLFGEGCDEVVGSPAAYPAGIPDAVFGVAGYGAAAVTALAIPGASDAARKTLAKAVVAGSVAAVGLSAYLTYAQPTRTGAWCFWCLASALNSTVMAAVAVSAAMDVLRES